MPKAVTQKALTLEERKAVAMRFTRERDAAVHRYADQIVYSQRYSDTEWEYRHVILPRRLVPYVPSGVCEEQVWRSLGIRQSLGWEMYMRHEPEPHVLLFRRPKNFDLHRVPFGDVSASINPHPPAVPPKA